MNSGCDVWHGDWIQVRKLPAQSLEIQYPAFEEVPGYLCVQYGMACPGNPVLLALNWRTGEMIPWDASLLPTPIPTITPTPGGERG
jgi:hypothetical protein